MPTAILNDVDIIQALNHLTSFRYNINTIVKKEITQEGELKIVWTHCEVKND